MDDRAPLTRVVPDFVARLGGGPFSTFSDGLRRQLELEWFGSPLHLLTLGGRKPEGLLAHPRDPRPVNPERGRQILSGAFLFGGTALHLGPQGDPWNKASPSRRFAVILHRFAWMADLLATGDAGARQGLRLYLDWRRVFGRWNSFSWSAEVLDRRVLNLACAARALNAVASDAEGAQLAQDLARQARHLLQITHDRGRAAERLAAAATAGCVLSGQAGDQICERALVRLERLLPQIVLADGGHATRSPEAGLELLFDLLTLDDALVQRGRAAPEALSRAIDRLTGAARFFTLADGALACFQGGEAVGKARITAALAHDDGETRPPEQALNAGYQKLTGKSLQVAVDAGAPARGDLSHAACGQPLAIEIVCGKDRLITNAGWSPDAAAPQAFRLTDAASTIAVGDISAGEPLRGWLANLLGPRLRGGARRVEVRRHETEAGLWLDLSHDGWVRRFGLTHERRLYVDLTTDELRGEDRLGPIQAPKGDGPRRYAPFAVRFHLHPDARASVARDHKSVLIKGASNIGWWLRNDAVDVAVEPSVHFENGVARRSTQIVLRSQARLDKGARIRWKLARAET
ncbi:heparinase II/III family protein [Caulobacter segnis]|uniref:heparinase II/III family protein n=1 Tax=Caulobacter segnis TaxID=88688 RepID=UPI0024105611|nr:heparinase II/III family protein [Caulobacter segnis]MDG2521568.1 heparinase II/III family protein [Caulobacter segnis]